MGLWIAGSNLLTLVVSIVRARVNSDTAHQTSDIRFPGSRSSARIRWNDMKWAEDARAQYAFEIG